MVKECPVIINNECVTVVRYDGIDIQLPSIGKDAKSVLIIKHVNGSYQIADSAEPVGRGAVEGTAEGPTV